MRLSRLPGQLPRPRVRDAEIEQFSNSAAAFGLAEAEIVTVREWARMRVPPTNPTPPEAQAALGLRGDPQRRAEVAFERNGAWPIGFSWPRASFPDATGTRRHLVARPLPGVPYAYASEDDYLAAYRGSHWGVTHRKAGWDCFRHVEVLFAGAVPLMPDAHRVPEDVMVFHPVAVLARLWEVARAAGPFPADDISPALVAYAKEHLTSAAMARYILGVAGYRGGRVLFVDARLRKAPDYLSALTLIGLKQVLARDCEVFRPAPYLYEDFAGRTDRLYGRGFGYSRVLDPDSRSEVETARLDGRMPDLHEEFDRVRPELVVFGSVTRSAWEVLQWAQAPSSRRPNAAILHGEDEPPSMNGLAALRRLGGTVFVREGVRRGSSQAAITMATDGAAP
jgi:hypothetical protein